MALGRRRREGQQEFWIATEDLPDGPRHVFYEKLNRILDAGGFDDHVEALCAPYYADGVVRPGLPPGIDFRMLFVGYFEDIGSQRGIAWRCGDSLSLRAFLGYQPHEPTLDHSSLSKSGTACRWRSATGSSPSSCRWPRSTSCWTARRSWWTRPPWRRTRP